MSASDLCDWAKSLIDRRAPESSCLDYKETVSIEGTKTKIDIARDVSSFANEKGGVVLYGVPEIEENGVPVPKPLSDCGMTVPPELPLTIENILQDVLEPPLPELEIRVLPVPEIEPKRLFLIYHPESWNKPHMVQGYKHGRYYRRGNFRAAIMEERQIEVAYATRRTAMERMDAFLERGDFRAIPRIGQFLRVIVLPRFTLARKEEMLESRFRDWLNGNQPGGRSGDWVPFVDGWSFRSSPSGAFHGNQYEIRVFHNGSICLTFDLAHLIEQKPGKPEVLRLSYIAKPVLTDLVLVYASKYFEYLNISGPLMLCVSLHNVNGFGATNITHHGVSLDSRTVPLELDNINFVEEASADELIFSQEAVLKRICKRLASAFGISPE